MFMEAYNVLFQGAVTFILNLQKYFTGSLTCNNLTLLMIDKPVVEIWVQTTRREWAHLTLGAVVVGQHATP